MYLGGTLGLQGDHRQPRKPGPAMRPETYNARFPPRHMAKSVPGATAPAPTAEKSVPPASYEDALAELERLVAQMEAGQLPLEKLLEAYKRGAELLAFCRNRLDTVEEQVRLLEDGQLKPWKPA